MPINIPACLQAQGMMVHGSVYFFERICSPEASHEAMTIDYLIHAHSLFSHSSVAERTDYPWHIVYQFISDRIQSIRQDITFQVRACLHLLHNSRPHPTVTSDLSTQPHGGVGFYCCPVCTYTYQILGNPSCHFHIGVAKAV